MTETINQLAILASSDEGKREELIRSQEQTILRTISSACRRFVNKSDDEFSIALCAFSKTVDVYSQEKGDFLPFAQMLIKRELIDYYRSQKNSLREISVAPHVLEGGVIRSHCLRELDSILRKLSGLRAFGKNARREGACPQHLPITDHLKKAASMFPAE